jgi:nitroimidazol reductase NimA-like FMN-containing flavoprotein (pyridoxamine 5'-phosphate oxidase superfamily)
MEPAADLPARLRSEAYCYFTTTGRVTGKPHEIEIWFGLEHNTLYLMSGDGQSDWVTNLRKTPACTVRIAQHTF